MLNVAVTLGSLCAEVDQVASEEEVVPRLDSHGVTHERAAVTDKSCGHGAGDTVVGILVSFSPVRPSGIRQARVANRNDLLLLDVHLGVFLGVHDGRNGDTEVGGRAPEVCIVEAMVSQCSRSISSPPNHWCPFSSSSKDHKYALTHCASSCKRYSSSFSGDD